MLLEKFVNMTEMGAERPLFLWYEDYKLLAAGILLNLEEVYNSIDKETETSKNIKQLIEILRSELPNEFMLAKHLMYVSSLFTGVSGAELEEQELISRYLLAVKKFYHLAQTSEHFADFRRRLKEKLSTEEQKAFDLKLFQHEGMMYCLEFYLSLYKAVQDAPSELEKRKYIESTEVNLGFGFVPGLWTDFNQDEALAKFIYSILDDDIRIKLTEAYFSAKLVIMKIHLNCDKQGNCQALYNDITLENVVSAFQEFIISLINVFEEKGVERLGSLFLKPYGDKVKLGEIKRQIVVS